VLVGVAVGVFVGVDVGVSVAVAVAVGVALGVGVGLSWLHHPSTTLCSMSVPRHVPNDGTFTISQVLLPAPMQSNSM